MDSDLLRLKIEQTLDVFPWYAQLAEDNGADLATVRSLSELPLLTSELLERHYYREQPFKPRDNVTCYRTSGTSSLRRKTIYYSEEDERRYLRIKAEIFRRILLPSGATTALSDMGTGHAASTAVDIFRSIGIEAQSIAFQQPIEEHLARLGTLRPHALYTMPSILDRLLSASVDDPAAWGIRHVILVGEIASPLGVAASPNGSGQPPEHYGHVWLDRDRHDSVLFA